MTTEPTAPAPRTRFRRFAILGLVIAIIVAGALAVRPFFPALVYPSRQLVGWELDHGPGGTRFDPVTAQTTTKVAVGIWVPGTPPLPLDTSWLELPPAARPYP